MDEINEDILRILLKTRRTMSASRITKILNEEGTKISRPTVRARLKKLKRQEWVVGNFKINEDRL